MLHGIKSFLWAFLCVFSFYGITIAAVSLLQTYEERNDAEIMRDNQISNTAMQSNEDPQFLVNPMIQPTAGCIGLLHCPGTNITNVIMQAANNDYFLNHLSDGSKNRAGELFMDCRNEPFKDGNYIIYGHNMKDGTMFHDLLLWNDPEFFKQHRLVEFFTEKGLYPILVFNAGQVTTESPAYNIFPANADKTDWLKSCVKNTYSDEIPDEAYINPILTLSTCTPDGAERFILQGVILERIPYEGGDTDHNE